MFRNGTPVASFSTGRSCLLGEVVGRPSNIWGFLHRFRLVLLWTIAGTSYLILLWVVRNSSYIADPLLDTYLQMAGSLIAFTFAANALVRFRGTHDRISLILAFGFVMAGLIEAGTSMTFYRGMLVTASAGNDISIGWLAGRRFWEFYCWLHWWWSAEFRSRENQGRKWPALRCWWEPPPI